MLPELSSSEGRLSLKGILEKKGSDEIDELLCSDAGSKDLHSKCAFKRDWQPAPQSGIAQFLKALDDAVRDNSKNEFISAVDDGVGDDNFDGENFCDWFDELEGLLDDLRNKLSRAESRE